MNRKEHIFTCLMEESAEVAKEASKVNRFGSSDIHPDSTLTHAEKLINEFHDLLAVYQMALDEINEEFIIDENKIKEKKEKLENMMKISKKLGRIK